jgi:hypothetical protein
MRRFFAVFGFVALNLASVAYSNENISANSIACVAIKIETLNQSEAGKKTLESTNALALGEECGKEHGWTSRQATAASFYAVSNSLTQNSRGSWATTGFAEDLPIRIKKRITMRQLNELVLQNQLEPFTTIMAEELAVAGSKLNADDTIDQLSLAESNAIGQKIGGQIMGLFLLDEFKKYFDDPSYESQDLLRLFTAINPDSTEVLERLK